MRYAPTLAFVLCAGAAPVPAAGASLPAAVSSADPRDEVPPGTVGLSEAGMAAVDSLITVAIREGAAPGAALVIGRYGRLVRLRGYGRTDWDVYSPLVTDSTLYDLASLTKAMGTATVAAQMVRDGSLLLDAPVHRYLRSWPIRGLHGQITVRHLLAHTSGLPPGSNMWPGAGSRRERLDALAGLPVRRMPGSAREYSDVGMILLGAILEEVTGARLDDLLYVRVFAPLAMHSTRFNPLSPAAGTGSFTLSQIAPTEYDRHMRRTLVHGVVHDLNAWILDGVAGHAGLFSNARDMAVFGQALLHGARGLATPLFEAGAFQQWLMQERAFDRPLGWDVPSGPESSAGRYFTSSSIGHTGFTGTSIWVDPVRDIFVVLLTNRLNPSAANQRHVQLRRDLHDAVQLAIVDMPIIERAQEDGSGPAATNAGPLRGRQNPGTLHVSRFTRSSSRHQQPRRVLLPHGNSNTSWSDDGGRLHAPPHSHRCAVGDLPGYPCSIAADTVDHDR